MFGAWQQHWKRVVHETKYSLAVLATLLLIASTVVAVSPLNTNSAQATVPTIDCVGTVSNGIAVTPSHGKVMYIDTGQGQNINASYVGYKVSVTGSNRSDIWVELDGFENDIVQLANGLDQYMQLGAINANSSKVSYFLLKADRPTTVGQVHNVRIFNGNPEISGNTELYSCKFTLQRVRETIKAAANKVLGVTTSSVSVIGDELVVEHSGQTGTIGAGSSPDNNMIWISPASNAAWPTRALKLTSVQVVYWTNKTLNGTSMTKTDELILSPAINSIGGNKDPKSYVATYRFKVIGKAKATVAPVAQISSGTQIKHTDMAGYYNTNGTAKYPVDTTTTTVSATATKVGAGTSNISVSGSNVVIGYTISVTNTGANTVVIDDIVDTAASSLVFRSGTARRDGAYPGTTLIPDAFSTNALLSDGTVDTSKKNFVFSGPFSVASNATIQIHYSMLAPCQSGSYANTAVARIGDTSIGTSGSTTQQVATTLNLTLSGGTCTINSSSQETQTVTRETEVTTSPATEISTTTNQSTGDSVSGATLNGSVDSNGVSGQTIRCEYSTDPSLAGSTLVSTSTPVDGKTTTGTDPIAVSCGLNNLVAGTTYYFRINVLKNDGNLATGGILSFATPPPTFSTPTVVTNSATSFSTSGSGANETVNVTLNGTINPRGNATRARFQYSTGNASCSSLTGSITTLTTLDYDDSDLPTLNLVLNGGFESQITFPVTGLTRNTNYCYRILGDYIWNVDTSSAPNTLNGSWVSFYASGTNPPNVSTEPATSIAGTTATLNGTVTKGTNNANISFCLTATAPTTAVLGSCISGLANPSPTSVSSGSVSPTLAATGLSPSTTYYFQVIATDSVGPTHGNIENFTTTGPPLATTSSATNILSTSATLNGSVIANGATASAYFCYVLDNPAVSHDANRDGYLDTCITGSTPDLAKLTNPTVTSTIAANASAAKAANVSGLTGNSKYHFQILANSANGWAKGEILDFTTPVAATVPVVTTVDASSVAGTTATLNGTITAGNADTTARFCLGTAIDLSGCTQVSATPSTVSGNTSTNITYAATGLTAGTVYYFKAQGTNSAGSSEGVIRSFTTTSDPAQATTNIPSPIGVTTSTLRGSVTAGTHAIQSVEFCLSTTNTLVSGVLQNCSAGTQGSVSGGTVSAGQSGSPTVSVTGLTGDTPYYVQVKANPASPGVTVYGEVVSFTTNTSLATAQTIAADNVSITTARLNGKVSAGTYPGTVSFCISSSDTESDGALASCLSGKLGSVSTASISTYSAVTDVNVNASSLASDTTYYFQVVITPNTGTAVRGSVLSFTTEVTPPESTTEAAEDIGGKSAKLKGSVRAGSRIASVRFCLATSNATSSWGGGNALSNCPDSATNWRSAGMVSSNSTLDPSLDTTGLTPNTTYYFQVATFPANGNPAFGEVRSFKTALIKPEVRTLAPSNVSDTSARLNGEANANNSRTTVRFCLSSSSDATTVSTSRILNACLASSEVSLATTRTPNNGHTIDDGSLVTFRAADLSETGLEDDVTYYYQAVATNDAGTAVGEILSFTTGEKRPEATTSNASSVSGKSARLNGSAKAGSKSVNVRFCLSAVSTTSYWSGANVLSICPNGSANWRNPTAVTSLSKNNTGAPYLDTTGLIPNKTYFFQVASFPTAGAQDPAIGEVKEFKTPLIAPEIETLAPSGISETGARLNAEANANNSRTTVRFCISESSATTNRLLDDCADTADVSRNTIRTPNSGAEIDGSEETMTTDQEAKLSVADLENETTYYYQAIATNDAGTAVGNIVSFSTGPSDLPIFRDPGAGGGSTGSPTEPPLPNRPTNPLTPTTPLPTGPANPGSTPGSSPAPSVNGPESPQEPTLTTMELGNKVVTLGELARERTPGFSDGTGITVLVTGSKVTGQFVVSPGEALDSLGLALALEESSNRWSEDFAQVTNADPISSPSQDSVYNAPVDETALDTFSRSGLATPKTLNDFNVSSSSKWLSVSADANTYLPGTKIYLTVTSEPVIFAEAIVDRFGKAQLVGSLPLDILPAGGHSIRLVGTRSIEGVSADSEGVLQLSSEAINQISQFDAGTMATVIMSGDMPTLNKQRLVREVLLGQDVPWWTIWFAGIISLLSLAFSIYRRKSQKRLNVVTPAVALAGSLPAIALGWWTISYLISYLGIAIGLGSVVLLAALNRYFSSRNNKARNKPKSRRVNA